MLRETSRPCGAMPETFREAGSHSRSRCTGPFRLDTIRMANPSKPEEKSKEGQPKKEGRSNPALFRDIYNDPGSPGPAAGEVVAPGRGL